MTESNFSTTVESLFKGMDSFITTKTVVGEAVTVNEHVTILPLVDVSFGVGAGAFGDDDKKKNSGAGGMGGKITPSSVLVLTDGEAKVVNVNMKNQDSLSKIIDLVPGVVEKIKGWKKNDDEQQSADNNSDSLG